MTPSGIEPATCQLRKSIRLKSQIGCSFGELNDVEDINKVWLNIKDNIKNSTKNSLGLHKQKQHVQYQGFVKDVHNF